jgi:hypothetical protein
LFVEKKGKIVKNCTDNCLAFLVDVAGHLNNLNKKLEGIDNLITEMYYNIRAIKFKLRL